MKTPIVRSEDKDELKVTNTDPKPSTEPYAPTPIFRSYISNPIPKPSSNNNRWGMKLSPNSTFSKDPTLWGFLAFVIIALISVALGNWYGIEAITGILDNPSIFFGYVLKSLPFVFVISIICMVIADRRDTKRRKAKLRALEEANQTKLSEKGTTVDNSKGSNLPLSNLFNNHIISYPAYLNMNSTNAIGFILICTIVIQVITGILLACFYNSSFFDAFDTVFFIVNECNLGFYIRSLHIIGSVVFMLYMFLN